MLLLDDQEALCDELVLVVGDLRLHSKVKVRVELKQKFGDRLSDFLVFTVDSDLPESLKSLHFVWRRFYHDLGQTRILD